MKNDLQDYAFRHKRYDNIDGTGEIFLGLMLLDFALLGYVQTMLPRDSIWRNNGFASLLFMYFALTPVMALAFWGRHVIKKRVTWPRTGYVAFGMGGLDDKTRRLYKIQAMISLAVFSAIIAGGLAGAVVLAMRHPAALNLRAVVYIGYLAFWVPLYAFWVRRMGREHPWKWFVLLVMVLGLVMIGFLGPRSFVGVARPVQLFVGLLWIISGVGTLISYLRHTQASISAAA